MERHGEKVGENCMVEQCLHSDSQCGCKRLKAAVGNLFVGKYREEEPWKQRTAAGRTIGVIEFKAGT